MNLAAELAPKGPDAEVQARYRWWLQGHPAALEMMNMVISMLETWDDLVDGDTPVSANDVNTAFFVALSGLQRNEFYKEHVDELLPVLEQGIFSWLTANEFQKTGRLTAAFVLRSCVMNVLIRSAYIIGGYQWGQLVANDYWSVATEPGAEARFRAEHGGDS